MRPLSHHWYKHLDFIVLDLLCLFIAYCASFALRFDTAFSAADNAFWTVLIIYELSLILADLLIGALSGVLRRGYLIELIMICEQTALALAVVTLVLYAGHIGGTVSRIVIFLTALCYIILDFAARALWKHYIKTSRPRSRNLRTAYIVTDFRHFSAFADGMKDGVWNDYRICGVTFTDGTMVMSSSCFGVPVITGLDEAARYICREWVDEVFLLKPGSSDEIKSFMGHCREMGVTLHYVINKESVGPGKQYIENIGEYSMVTTGFSYMSPRQIIFKRSCDIVFGIIGCIAAVAIGIIIGPIIYIKSPGPIIFKQRRVGKNGRIFSVLKFRSMYLDAEERKKELITDNRIADGMMFKLDFDPRIIGNRVLPDGTRKTGIGEFIRKTSLDEFPQFFNVLKGDMSLVGTRPPTIDEWEKYEFHHRARLAIKPGITGLWQVSGRSEITDFEEVVRLDTEYIANYRIALDIKIFFKTIVVLLKRKGAM